MNDHYKNYVVKLNDYQDSRSRLTIVSREAKKKQAVRDEQVCSRLTIVSREAKKKQAVRDEQVCYLQVAPL